MILRERSREIERIRVRVCGSEGRDRMRRRKRKSEQAKERKSERANPLLLPLLLPRAPLALIDQYLAHTQQYLSLNISILTPPTSRLSVWLPPTHPPIHTMDPSNGAAKQWEVYVQIIAGCLLCLLAPLRSEYKRTLFSLQFAIGGFAFGYERSARLSCSLPLISALLNANLPRVATARSPRWCSARHIRNRPRGSESRPRP